MKISNSNNTMKAGIIFSLAVSILIMLSGCGRDMENNSLNNLAVSALASGPGKNPVAAIDGIRAI